jgi:site-specific DNA recombinase
MQRPDFQYVGSFKDNDISASAHSDEERPDFQRLMTLIRSSGVDVVLCTQATRFTRWPLEAEVVIDLVWRKQTSFHTILTTRGGYYDLRTSAGRKAFRNEITAAAGESDQNSDSARVKKAALARKGMPNGGRRAYGFEPNGIDHRESEIAVMYEMADRRIRRESPRHIICDLNDRGIPTAEGGKWTKATMDNMLRRKRYAPYGDTDRGIRVHKGVEYKAVWKAVFDTVTWEKLQAALNAHDHLTAKRGNPRKYLLAGYLYCNECQSVLGGSMKRDRPHQPNMPRYKCKVYDGYGRRRGCAKVSILAEPLEDWVTQCVLERLDSPELAAIFAEGDDGSAQLKAALDANQIQKARLDELIDDYYGSNPDGLTREQFMRAKSAAELALATTEAEVEKHSAKHAVVGIPIGQTVTEAWLHNTDLGWRRELIGLVVDQIYIKHGGGKPRYECKYSDKAYKFDPNRVVIQWKV